MKTNEKMNAVVATGYGGQEVLQLKKVSKPQVKENEVLIKVMASSATTADTMMRTGKPYFGRLFTGLKKPPKAIPGTGFAGFIVGSGKKVTFFKPGVEVFGETTLGFSTNAEYLAVPENGVILSSTCKKSPVLDKKTSFYKPFKIEGVYELPAVGSRLAKSGNPQFTVVNEEFSDKRNAEPLAREHKLKKLICEQNGVFLPTLSKPESLAYREACTICDGHLNSINLLKRIARQFPLEKLAEAHRYIAAGHKKGNVVIINQVEN